MPDHLTCLLTTGQGTTVKIRHGTMDWFKIGKGVHQGCMLSPCLFNLYAENTMQNAGLDEAQVGIKIPRRNINNRRYTDDTTLMEKIKKEIKKKISWLQSPSAVILEPRKIKSVTVSTDPPSICHEVMGPDARILVF